MALQGMAKGYEEPVGFPLTREPGRPADRQTRAGSSDSWPAAAGSLSSSLRTMRTVGAEQSAAAEPANPQADAQLCTRECR